MQPHSGGLLSPSAVPVVEGTMASRRQKERQRPAPPGEISDEEADRIGGRFTRQFFLWSILAVVVFVVVIALVAGVR